jgi:hypothetical protein
MADRCSSTCWQTACLPLLVNWCHLCHQPWCVVITLTTHTSELGTTSDLRRDKLRFQKTASQVEESTGLSCAPQLGLLSPDCWGEINGVDTPMEDGWDTVQWGEKFSRWRRKGVGDWVGNSKCRGNICGLVNYKPKVCPLPAWPARGPALPCCCHASTGRPLGACLITHPFPFVLSRIGTSASWEPIVGPGQILHCWKVQSWWIASLPKTWVSSWWTRY